MDRRQFIARAAAGLAASAFPARWAPLAGAAPAGVSRTPRPNILLIVADDLGYHDLGVQGCADIPTPHIDSLAAAGVRFTDGYVSCPVCSPTRAGLMTGRYQQRFGHEFNPGPGQESNAAFGLALDETTLATRLKARGYATGMFGKWHLGFRPEFHPQRRGFDEFYGFLGGGHPYLTAGAETVNPILRAATPVASMTYTTDDFAREAASFVERHKDEPFFVYLPFNAVHTPLQALPKYLDRFSAIQDEKRRTFAAMLSALDDGVGTVLAKLRQHKLEENTLIFFISDNGGPTGVTTSNNAPLRGVKGQVLEGGIRVPFIMQWKRHLPAGKVYRQPVIALDIHPTALAVAGGAPAKTEKPLDGVNLIPYLTGDERSGPHEHLFWRFGAQWAVRGGEWKLLAGEGAGPRLYNLAQDIGETKDLAAERPEKLKALQAAYDAWNAQLGAPRWKTSRAPGQRNRRQRQGRQGGGRRGEGRAGRRRAQ